MDKKIDATAFEAFVVKAFKLTPEEVASLYNEAGELTDFSLIDQKDTARIQKLITDRTSQYNKGFKEGAEKLEKAIKEKYEVESELTGVDLFDHVVETKVADVKGAAPEDVMKHPEVIKLINTHTKEKKNLAKEWQDKLDAKESEINQNNLFKDVESAALAEFENLNPILPEDARKAKALKDVFIAEVKKHKHQKEGDGFSVLKDDGTLLTDEKGFPVTFASHIKNIAETYFDFKTAEERSSSGLKTPKTPPPGNKVRVPKSKEDYVSIMQDQTLTSKERIEIKNLAVKAGFA
jgi:hypothetical protein